MWRLLLLLACLGLLHGQQLHITLKTRETSKLNLNPVQQKEVPSFHIQMLTNIKAKGVQTFVGEVSVGTPPQLMTVAFDTVNPLSYFPSARCQDPLCKMRRQYNSSASSTYEAVGTPFDLPNGQNASGVLFKDSLSLAGVDIDSVVLGEAESMWNKWLAVLPPDGILGLGLRGLAPEGVRPLLDVMAEQGLISERLFGVWLGRDPQGGELTIGGLDERLYQGQLTWANLTPPVDQWWAAPADTIQLEGLPQLDLCPQGRCAVVPATNSPYFIVSEAQERAINEALGGVDIGQPGAAGLDCTTLYKLPTLRIAVGGRNMEMGPLEYTFVLRFDGGLQMCVSGFIGVPGVDDHTMLLGTLFMQKFYIAFDRENDRLGFADSA